MNDMPSCAGPCQQGRSPCPTPETCRLRAAEILAKNADTVLTVDRVFLMLFKFLLAILVVLGTVWALSSYAEAAMLAVTAAGLPRQDGKPLRPEFEQNPIDKLLTAVNDIHERQCRQQYRQGLLLGWIAGVTSSALCVAIVGWITI
jgi:hypothetical protein